MTTNELYRDQIPAPLRWLGCWGIQDNRTSYRFTWGEINTRLGFGLGYSVYHECATWSVHLLWPAIYIKAPMLINQQPGTEDWWATYGFSFVDRAIHLNWRTRCKIIHLPWDWTHVRHDVFDKDGNRLPYKPDYCEPKENDGRHKEAHSYRYVLRNGTIQDRTATIYGDEMEWRWIWLKWLPWPRKIKRCISVEFDGEVGERTGSWKGGTIGCGYEWRQGETMLEALRRMERERKF